MNFPRNKITLQPYVEMKGYLFRVIKMMKKLLLSLATVALAVAGAATHTVKIFDPVYLNGHELKPGDYKLELKEGTAVLKSGKKQLKRQ